MAAQKFDGLETEQLLVEYNYMHFYSRIRMNGRFTVNSMLSESRCNFGLLESWIAALVLLPKVRKMKYGVLPVQ